MSWAGEGDKTPQKPEYPYNKQLSFVNILPSTSRVFALLTGPLDPTGTWKQPIAKWVHSWKSPKNGTVTYISMNYSYACPIAVENEIFKLRNPNYKQMNMKLPYPLSKKILCPVWDYQLQKVSYLLAGKGVEQEIDLLMTQEGANFTGFVKLTRIGQGLDTKYRVDIVDPATLPPIPTDVVASTLVKFDRLDTSLTPDEFRTKIGIDPIVYWTKFDELTLSGQIPPIDISGWGIRFGLSGGSVAPSTWTPPTPPPGLPTAPPPVPATPQAPPPPPVDVTNMTFSQMMAVKCSTGMFKDKTIGEAYLKSGMPVLTFLSRAGVEQEKAVVATLLSKHEADLQAYAKGEF